MNAPKEVHICGDDFAESPAKSQAILQLVAAQRLTAVSCFTDAPLWKSLGPELIDIRGPALIGLHFNLTHPLGHREEPLIWWMLRSAVGAVNRQWIETALQRQLDNFNLVAGRLPDFLDGHHHVHAFPVIRTVIDECLTRLDPHGLIRVRNVADTFGGTDARLKRFVITRMASLRRGDCDGGARRLNTAFAGDYSIRPSGRYVDLFLDWVSCAPDGALIMCHPALPGEAANTASAQEFDFLSTSDFASMLAASQCTLRGLDDHR